ncbi:MAG: ankyrin repeat domain-containing protein [Armatimonadetes bacterium]|nr:ankyrin repeat domain-containing protein [Armatimonadota bacterium]
MTVLGASFATAGVSQSTRKTTDPPVASRGKMCTDLFLAIGKRDTAEVKSLLEKGADPNSRNGLEFTPLYIAAASYQMDVMQELLKAGAKPDAESNYGTPLTFASMTGNVYGARILFGHNVKIDPIRSDGMTPLMMASHAGAPELVTELVKRKADVNIKDDGGSTALSLAARSGHTEVGKILLGAGAKVNFGDMEGETPLMNAAMTGHPEFVKMLLAKGANPNAKDAKGRTALMLAVSYGDYPEVVRTLLGGGANAKMKDPKGRTAAMLASAKGFSESAAVLGVTSPKVATVTPRAAISRSLKLVQSSMLEFNRGTACISCHQEGLGRMALGEAKARGYGLDQEVQKAQMGRIHGMLMGMKPLHEGALKSPEVMKQIPLFEINEVVTTDTWLLCGMADMNEKGVPGAAEMASVLAVQQQPDGCYSFSLPRAPMQSSPFTFTALTIKALKAYAPKSDDTAKRIAMAKDWLLKAEPKNSEDRAGRLLGLKWAGADEADINAAKEAILKDQKEDGGWNQLPGLHTDAYATGQALYALHAAGGVPTSDAAYQKGVSYLLRTQDDDGSWFVAKRAIPANNYFDAGFPHGESQYASFNGTCWAMMALLETLPRK